KVQPILASTSVNGQPGCELKDVEARIGSFDMGNDCLIHLSWAHVHSKCPDVQLTITMFKGTSIERNIDVLTQVCCEAALRKEFKDWIVWKKKVGFNKPFTKIYSGKVEGKSVLYSVLGFKNNGEVVLAMEDDSHIGQILSFIDNDDGAMLQLMSTSDNEFLKIQSDVFLSQITSKKEGIQMLVDIQGYRRAGWQEKLDVKIAFLHSDLDENIYMTQLEGFQSGGKEENLVGQGSDMAEFNKPK
ncbi:hypothetical protein Tco_1061884, partial [Tanacetum coccineum]